MKEISLETIARPKSGKGSARSTRREGRIPAITYGPETTPISMSVDDCEFRAALRVGGVSSSIFTLKLDGKETKAILREMQRDAITSDVIHLDFLAISMDKPFHISVPVNFEGIPEGVKVDGGIMQVTMRELEISCLPTKLPETITVDVSELKIGESIHVRDVIFEDGEILAEGKRTMVVISAPTVVVETVEEGEEGEEGDEAAEGAEGDAAAATADADGKDAKDADKGDDKKDKN